MQELERCKPAGNNEPGSDCTCTSYFLTCENLSLRKKVAQPSMATGFPEYTCDSNGKESNRVGNGIEQNKKNKSNSKLPLLSFSCKAPDIHVCQAQVQKNLQSGLIVPKKGDLACFDDHWY